MDALTAHCRITVPASSRETPGPMWQLVAAMLRHQRRQFAEEPPPAGFSIGLSLLWTKSHCWESFFTTIDALTVSYRDRDISGLMSLRRQWHIIDEVRRVYKSRYPVEHNRDRD
jgi:hypothetical protein